MLDADVVCVSTNHWTGLPTSKQHLMSVLARSRRVLYVDPPIDIFSVLARRRRWSKLSRMTNVTESLSVLSPLVLSGPSGPRRSASFHARFARCVRRGADALGIAAPILWTFAPEHVYYAGTQSERVLIYHAADEPASFSKETAAVRSLEKEMMDRADLVFVSSRPLLDARSSTGKAHLLPNAADARHYKAVICGNPDASTDVFLSHLARPRRVPTELELLPRPVVLYGGAAYDWFDVDLLLAVARRRQEWSFVLVGPAGRSVTRVAKARNVHLLGRKSYSEFPWYVCAADVAVIPWRDCLFSRHAEPIVLYEYLLCGKQVVATPFPAAVARGELVRTARDPDGFVAAIETALARSGDPGEVRRRVGFGLANTWEERAERALELVERTARRKGN